MESPNFSLCCVVVVLILSDCSCGRVSGSLSLFVCSIFFMEMGSDEEDQIKNVVDGHKNKKKKIDTFNNKDSLTSKSKRQMKTPFQLQTLEKVYAGLILISPLVLLLFLSSSI